MEEGRGRVYSHGARNMVGGSSKGGEGGGICIEGCVGTRHGSCIILESEFYLEHICSAHQPVVLCLRQGV